MLINPKASSGRIHNITPAAAGWTYVGLDVHRLAPGDIVESVDDEREKCLVLISGRAKFWAEELNGVPLGGRMSPFEGMPASAYVPWKTKYQLVAATECEIAVCSAPADLKAQRNSKWASAPRVVVPDQLTRETRGVGSNVRYATKILWEEDEASSLLVVEVITPAGHWSSYPPHKHDTDNLPHESQLEEAYYYRHNPEQGFAIQRIYTDDRSLDTVVVPHDRDIVLVARGYHPVGAPPMYEVYYLNVMAGPKRVWRFRDDPDHAWARI